MCLQRSSWLLLTVLALIMTGTVHAEGPVGLTNQGAVPSAPVTEPATGAQEKEAVPAPVGEVRSQDGQATEKLPAAEEITRRLTMRGLENVSARQDGERLLVSYENRRYRWQVTGLGVALAVAAKEAPEGSVLFVTPRIWGVPEFEVRVTAADYLRFLEGTLSEKEMRSRFSVNYRRGPLPAGGKNKSFRRFDVTGGIGFRASFTDEDPNEGVHGRFLAGLEGALLPGIGLSAQEVIPLEKDSPILTQARVSGVLHPAGPVFLALSGGRLGEDMDAVQGEVAWVPPSGRWSLRLAAAAGRDRFFAQSASSTLLTATRWIGRRDISLSVVAGRFWEGDRGAEVYLQSGFRERRFLVGGGRSGGVTRTRIQVTLPLGPRVQPEPRTVRFKVRDTFNAFYRAPRGLVVEARVGGVIPPSLLEERARLFSPEIVRSYLKELRRSAELLQ